MIVQGVVLGLSWQEQLFADKSGSSASEIRPSKVASSSKKVP